MNLSFLPRREHSRPRVSLPDPRPASGPTEDYVPGEAVRAWLAPIGRVEHHADMLRTAADTCIRVYALSGGLQEVVPGEMGTSALLNPSPISLGGRPPRFNLRVVVRCAPNPRVRLGQFYQMRMRRVRMSIAQAQRSGGMPTPQEERTLRSMHMLWDAVRRAGQTPIDIWMFFVVSAAGQEDLEAACAELERAWRDRATLVMLDHEQLQAFQETWFGAPPSTFLGRAERITRPGRGMLATATAATALWTGSAGGACSDGIGIAMGNRAQDGRFTFLDMGGRVKNKNMVAAGATGEGKSVLLHSMVSGALIEGDVAVTFDVDGEYLPHARRVGARVVDMTMNSGNYFEPLACPEPLQPPHGASREQVEEIHAWNGSRMRRIFAKIGAMVEVMAGSVDVHPGETNAAIRAAFQIFEDAGIDREDPKAWDRVPARAWPGVRQWYETLARWAEADPRGMAARLAGENGRIWRFFEGDMAGLFGTRLEERQMIQADWTVFHVASLADSNDDQTAGAVKTLLLGDALMNQLIRVRMEQRRYALVEWDEGQRQLSSSRMAHLIATWATTIRKWNGAAIVATNVPQVLWETQYGGWLWDNTDLKVLFWLEDSSFRAIQEHGDVPDEVIARLRSSKGTNQFALRYKGGWDYLKLHLPPEEMALYETRKKQGQD